MSAKIPGSLETQTREPLDGKYWVQSFTDINTGLTFQGLLRFEKATDKLWIKLTSGWVEIPTGSSAVTPNFSVGSVTVGPLGATITGNTANPVLNLTIPEGLQGESATIEIERTEPSPDAYAHIINIGDNTHAQWVVQIPEGGKSMWIAYSPYSNGSNATFTLNTQHRFVSILQSLNQPNIADFNTWVKFVGDDGGAAGESAYQTWLDLGNSGTEQDFLDTLNGSNGQSAYELWLELGNEGTEADFIDSLQATAYNGVTKDYVDDADANLQDQINNLPSPDVTKSYVDQANGVIADMIVLLDDRIEVLEDILPYTAGDGIEITNSVISSTIENVTENTADFYHPASDVEEIYGTTPLTPKEAWDAIGRYLLLNGSPSTPNDKYRDLYF